MSRLLESLAPSDWSNKKTSVQDCLRSKKIPNVRVSQLLSITLRQQQQQQQQKEADWDAAVVCLLKKGHDGPIATRISHLATHVRFIQLLLELGKPATKKQHNHHLEPRKLRQWTETLIRALAAHVHEVVPPCDHDREEWLERVYSGPWMEDNADNPQHPPQVSFFAFACLVRLTPYVSSHPYLLSLLWNPQKNANLDTTNTNNSTHKLSYWTGPWPPVIACEAMTMLTRLFREGSRHLSTGWPPIVTTVLAFLLTRIEALMDVTCGGDGTPVDRALLTGLSRALGALHRTDISAPPAGLPEKIQSCWQTCRARAKKDGPSLVSLMRKWLDNVQTQKETTGLGTAYMVVDVLNDHLKQSANAMEQDHDDALALSAHLLLGNHLLLYSSGKSSPSPLARVVQTVVRTLLRAETTLQAPRQISSLYWLLFHWLHEAVEKHPLSGALVMSVVFHYIQVLERIPEAADSFFSAAVALAFDSRTSHTLRATIVALLPMEKVRTLVNGERRSLLRKRSRSSHRMLSAWDIAILDPWLEPLESSPPSSKLSVKMLTKDRNIKDAIQSCRRAVKSNDPDAEVSTFVALRQLRFTCLQRQLPGNEFCFVLETSSKHSPFGGLADPMKQAQVQLEGVDVLSEIGQALSASTNDKVIKTIAAAFRSFLSHPSWIIQTHAITSMVKFASSLPASHKPVIPTCVPPTMSTRLQNRLRASLGGLLVTDVKQWRSRLLDQLIPSSLFETAGQPILRTPDSHAIVKGSLVLEMPTQENRTALVVFPPGESSRRDIRHMLGISDENSNDGKKVWTLQGTVTQMDGLSCKLILC